MSICLRLSRKGDATCTRRLIPKPRVLVVGLLVLFGSLAAVAAGLAGRTPPGCGVLTAGTLVESRAFVPGDEQRGPMKQELPLNQSGVGPKLPDSPGLAPGSIDGKPLTFVISRVDRIKLYYLPEPIGPSMTTAEFFAAGGIRFEHEPRLTESQFTTFAEDLIETSAGRALAVEVGPYQGALVYADPTPDSDQRTHNLYWSDGKEEFALIAVMGPEQLVNIGRGLVCGTS